MGKKKITRNRPKRAWVYMGLGLEKQTHIAVKKLAKKSKIRKCAMIRILVIEALAARQLAA